MNFKIKERRITVLLSNKGNESTSSDNKTILKFCESLNFSVSDRTALNQRKNEKWSDRQKMLLIKRLVTDNDTYKRLNFANTYRRLNFYFQHRETIPSTGIYDCRIDPFNYKSAIGTVSFVDPKRVPVSSPDVGVL